MRLIYPLTGLVLAIVAINVFIYCTNSKSPVVYLDNEFIQGQLIRQLAEVKASDTQIKQATRKFNQALDNILSQYSGQKKVIILRKKDVLAGGKNITDEIVLKLSDAMRKKA